MKEETLKKFREGYTTYLEAADSEFKEIDELKKELEKDPRVIQLKKLQEEINNDSRTKRLEELKKIKKDYEQQKQEYGYWNHTNSYYAYIKTRPIINGEDSCGILVRFTSRWDEEFYFYLDVENLDRFTIEKDKAEEFEKGHIIIPVPSGANEEAIRREFFIGCITATPEESAKSLIKKYNAKEEEKAE